MAATGVLPFVRGIDFTRYDFQGDAFPETIGEMRGLRWLKLDRANINRLPDNLSQLDKLEQISIKKCSLTTIKGHDSCDFGKLSSLRVLNLRNNYIPYEGIPKRVFDLEDLTTLDLSNNRLIKVPEELEKAKSILVLNLGNNSIESIPNQLFIELTDLMHLDLSNNKLESLPPQMRRLVNLQTLSLNHNPLLHAQLRQLTALTSLRTLNMRDTQRTVNNFPSGIEALTNLAELDLSFNDLPRLPDALYQLRSLKRLDISSNQLTELPQLIERWTDLQYLNLSRNKLTALPSTLVKLTSLQRLYVNSNELDFSGIPGGISKLLELRVFSASNNKLEMIPEELCRCPHLKKLILNTNQLITLPQIIHLLTDLEVLDIGNNDDVVIPPKPPESVTGAGPMFYNIDFSLENQLREASGAPPSPTTSKPTDATTRIKGMLQRRRQKAPDGARSEKVLEGMKKIAKEKATKLQEMEESRQEIKGKRWNEFAKPQLDYSEIFEETVGQIPGLTIFEIENFLPVEIEEQYYGKFYKADCYIILQTYIDDSNSINWKIYFWIGQQCSLDKKACAAIHAVNLRNLLGAECRTIREEMGDESDEFLSLFDDDLVYIDGGRTASGFFSVEEVDFETRLYRCWGTKTANFEPVPAEAASFDPRFVFLVDAGKKIFVWVGRLSRGLVKSKVRLVAEKVNKNERKNESEIITYLQGYETREFWQAFGGSPSTLFKPIEHVPDDFVPPPSKLFEVGLGRGYLELPQLNLQNGLLQKLLETRQVYILDTYSDVWVWIGRKSPRLLRAAAIKLSQELYRMIERPPYAAVTRCMEGTEPQIFKTKFNGWDDVIPVDYTRSVDSIQRRGHDLKKILEEKTKTDLTALFLPRQPPMTMDEAEQCMADWKDDLADEIQAFVLEGKKFVRLPETEFGQFYSDDCYVFLCRYWEPPEEEVELDEDEEEPEEDTKCVVYFWQGRNASNMGWLTFTFTLQKKFEAIFGDKLEVVRQHQQQENIKFLSHFGRRFIIHHGRRNEEWPEGVRQPSKMYQLRSNGGPLTLRCMQIAVDAKELNSEFCYILVVPFDASSDMAGIVYVWLGSKSSVEDGEIAERIGLEYQEDNYTVQTVHENEEPENFFWVALGGVTRSYDHSADYMRYARLFRCSNEKGYFTVSEKCADFCQDDLADDDVMILDTGEQVFLWMGRKTSEVEIKLAFKSAQVYIQHIRSKDPSVKRKLIAAFKGRETRPFKRCFHGWGEFKEPFDVVVPLYMD